MMSSSHDGGLSMHGSAAGSAHGSVMSVMSDLTVHSQPGRYEEADKFSLERLMDDAQSDPDAARRLKRRKKYELRLVTRYNRTTIEDRADVCWYLIDSRWLNAWYAYVKDKTHTEPPPGRISSRDLLDEKGEPLKGLRAKIDYRAVVPMVYYILVEFHGKDKDSPELCRYEVDIYARPLPVDRIIKISQHPVVKARIMVSKLRPKWLKWERDYPSDDEDDELPCCFCCPPWCRCGLTKDHLEAFVFWCVACWSRKKSGRGNISYRQYQPLRPSGDALDDMNRSSHSWLSYIGGGAGGGTEGGGWWEALSGSVHNPVIDGSQHSTTSGRSSVGGRSRRQATRIPDDDEGSDEEEKDADARSTVSFTSFRGSSAHGQQRTSSSEHGEGAGDEEQGDEQGSDTDSDSSGEDTGRLEIGPADVNVEKGTWFRPFG